MQNLKRANVDSGEFRWYICGLFNSVNFSQPVQCEDAIETWLNSLVSAIKTALQYQLATATGVEKPAESRSIHSAGARKVQLIPEKQSKQQQARGEHAS